LYSLENISDITVGASALGTFFVALYGVRGWSRELRGKANFDISQRILKEVYSYRNAMQLARSLKITNKTSDELEKIYFDKDRKSDFLISSLNERWYPVSETAQSLASLSIEAEVFLGKEVKDLIDNLVFIASDLRTSIDVFIDFEVNKPPHAISFFEENPICFYNLQSKITRDLNGEDNLSLEIEKTIEKLEKSIRSNFC
jgi:hypothetical protein